jgi:hypothetical protein
MLFSRARRFGDPDLRVRLIPHQGHGGREFL